MAFRFSSLDLALRLAFFAVAPVAIVFVSALFPIRGVLVDVALALTVFLVGEASQRFLRFPWLRWLLAEAMDFERYYRKHGTRPFLYYVFYPLLFPYWLSHREARREFLVFRGYTVSGLAILVGSFVWQYFQYWRPDLGWKQFLPYVALTLTIEILLALGVLMPLATTVVHFHHGRQRWKLSVVLAVGLVSTLLSLGYLMTRRDPIVSYATNERVAIRSRLSPVKAQRTLRHAAWAAMKELWLNPRVEGDGKVMGPPLERAREKLAAFYKSDEVYAFDLWATPRHRPQVLVIYFEYGFNRRVLWLAIDHAGRQLTDRSRLPRGVFSALHLASDGTGDLLGLWPEELSSDELLR